MIIKRCHSYVESIGQASHIDFKNWGVGNSGLQDELTSGVINGNSLNVELGVEDIQLVGNGVRVDAESLWFVVINANVGRVGFMEIGDAVTIIWIRVVI